MLGTYNYNQEDIYELRIYYWVLLLVFPTIERTKVANAFALIKKSVNKMSE